MVTGPDFIIIGAQKAASTALMRALSDEPRVYLPENETQYFRDPWFQFQDMEELARAVETDKPGVLRRGIKCPDYLAEEPCAPRIKATLGDIPMMMVAREPVVRAVSAYFWGMQWGMLPLQPIETGMRQILRGEYDRIPYVASVLDYGRYGRHLSRFHEIFGRELVLVLTDDELRRDPSDALGKALQHIGLKPTSAPVSERGPVNSGVYSMRRLKVLQCRHRYITRPFDGYEQYGTFPLPARGAWGRLANRSISVLDRIVLSRAFSNDRPALSPELQAELAAYYREDLELFQEIAGVEVGRWLSNYP